MTEPTGAVVAGVDGSSAGLRAVRWAARECVRRRAPLRLAHVMEGLEDPWVADAELAGRYGELLLERARDRLAQARAAALEVAPALEVTDSLASGSAARELVELSRAAQLVVLGDHGMGTFADLVLGSVARAVSAHAASPVVVVRGRADAAPTDPVVVGVDGSPLSEAATGFAFEAAAARGAPLVAVHAWWGLLVDPAAAPFGDLEAADATEHAVLAERLAGWGEKYPDVAVRRVVEPERPGALLVRWSQDAQLVVVGSRGRGGFTGLLLGSVSQALMQHAGCPVAIARPAPAEAEA